MNWQNEKILVTGGGGFLGRHIVKRLISKNCKSIRTLGRNPKPELAKLGVEVVCGDIRDFSAVSKACEFRSIVVHTAAFTEVHGKKSDFWEINVTGTENVIGACRKHDISYLVHTSSPSVVSFSHNIEGDNESLPYPKKYLAYYPESKAISEKSVLSANSANLATVSLRPHLIWGPEDPHLLPRIAESAKKGRLIRVGNGRNLVDLTYVENAAEAHICAIESLRISQTPCGKAYFITDGNPVVLWDWINDFLKKTGLPPVKRGVSYRTAYFAGAVMEMICREPPITCFIAGQLAFSHYFDISAAKKELGYNPVVKQEEALEKTVEWMKKRFSE